MLEEAPRGGGFFAPRAGETGRGGKLVALFLLLLLVVFPGFAQRTVVTLDSAERQALRRHPRLRQSA